MLGRLSLIEIGQSIEDRFRISSQIIGFGIKFELEK